MLRMLAVAAIALILIGCGGLGGEASGTPANSTAGINGSADVGGEVANGPAPEEPCLREFRYCYTGETILSRDCINGKPVKWVCEPYYARHNRSVEGIPSQYMYIAEYACYWENRDKFGLSANYHPAAMCEGPIVLGWKESCDCAYFIDLNERSNPQRYYIKR